MFKLVVTFPVPRVDAQGRMSGMRIATLARHDLGTADTPELARRRASELMEYYKSATDRCAFKLVYEEELF